MYLFLFFGCFIGIVLFYWYVLVVVVVLSLMREGGREGGREEGRGDYAYAI